MARNKPKNKGSTSPGFNRAVELLLHTTAVIQLTYGVYYFYNLEMPVFHPYAGKFKFLTFFCAIIQLLYYIVCLVNDFVGTNELVPRRAPAIRKFKDWLMSTLAFPVCLNVAITFWTVYIIDRELVLPKVLDPVFPSWLNHILHTNIVVFIVLEMFTSYCAYPTRAKGLTGLAIFMSSYLVWLHIIKHNCNVWVYPFLEVLQLPQRILFFAAVLGFTSALYLLGEFINNVIWAKEVKLLRKSK